MPHDRGCDCGIWPPDRPAWPTVDPDAQPGRTPDDHWRPRHTRGEGLLPQRRCRECQQPIRVSDARDGVYLALEPHPWPHEQVSPRWPSYWWDELFGLVDRVRGSEARYGTAPLFPQHHCPRTRTQPAPAEREHMTTPTFGTARPPGEGVRNEDLQGKLLLISVTEKKTEFPTSNGPADVVVADIVDLSGGEEHPGNFLFGKVLFGQFEVGVKYLGTIGKGAAQPGKSAPWVFTGSESDPAAVAQAQQYLAYKQQQAPAPAAPAPAPSGAPAAPWAS